MRYFEEESCGMFSYSWGMNGDGDEVSASETHSSSQWQHREMSMLNVMDDFRGAAVQLLQSFAPLRYHWRKKFGTSLQKTSLVELPNDFFPCLYIAFHTMFHGRTCHYKHRQAMWWLQLPSKKICQNEGKIIPVFWVKPKKKRVVNKKNHLIRVVFHPCPENDLPGKARLKRKLFSSATKPQQIHDVKIG